MHNVTIAQMAADLESGQYSSVELTQHFLARIKQYNTDLNAIITLDEEQALTRAEEADRIRATGRHSLLCGIPILHKDIFCTKDLLTTCGSKMLHNFIPPYESTVTKRCLDAGMVPLGKTNMDEFAMGSSNETSFFGPCKNPWDLNRIPGGSSGGSAAAVAARLAPLATGSDTGGSIRQPAALCGITGLKPTYGRISRWGMIAYASSLDQAGPMTLNCEDAAHLLNVIASFDDKDATSADKAVLNHAETLTQSIKGIKIGVPKELFAHSLESSVEQVIQTALKAFEALGAQLVDISLPTINMATPTYYVIAPAEASSNLSRYDGVRFGHRCDNPADLQDLYERSRGEGFGTEVKRRIMIGTYALSAGYYDAYYAKAQKVRRLIQEDFIQAYKEVDFIISPTTPTPAFNSGETVDPVTMYLNDIYTIPANLAGLPALSIPAGFSDGLPVGIQLIGQHFEETRLLNAGHQYQLAHPWHTEAPPDYA